MTVIKNQKSFRNERCIYVLIVIQESILVSDEQDFCGCLGGWGLRELWRVYTRGVLEGIDVVITTPSREMKASRLNREGAPGTG
jgi:hypothetical protein